MLNLAPANHNGSVSAITRIARELGADSIFVIRGAQQARLEFKLPVSADMARELARAHNVEIGTVTVSPVLDLSDKPLMLVIQFSQADGGQPGLEAR